MAAVKEIDDEDVGPAGERVCLFHECLSDVLVVGEDDGSEGHEDREYGTVGLADLAERFHLKSCDRL